MQIRLYFDEDAQRGSLTGSLRLRGVNVQTTNEAGMVGKSDEEQLEYATSVGRVIYSFNVRDFNALHTEWLIKEKSHGSIILAPQLRYSIGERMRRLLVIVSSLSAEQMQNRIEFLSSWG